jgi:hypothetical protein
LGSFPTLDIKHGSSEIRAQASRAFESINVTTDVILVESAAYAASLTLQVARTA